MEISAKVSNLFDLVKNTRRELHKMPEESEKEFLTSEYITRFLFSRGYKVKKIGTGVVADVSGKDTSYRIALRADIDALPICEKTDVEYRSTNGFMHACGHDGHTAILLALSDLLKKEKPSVNVRLIFQFGEEGYGGAEKMIAGGALDGVDEIYALHVDPSAAKGALFVCDGAMFAGAVEFDFEIEGKSSHCADASNGIDAIKALSYVLNKADGVNAHKKNNSLFHIGKIVAGDARNIVAGSAKASCTLRFFDEADRETIMMNLSRLLVEADNAFGTSHRVNVETVYDPLINSAAAVGKIKRLFPETRDCAPRYTAEDFGAFLAKTSGCMVWLGVKDETFSSPLHSDTFGFNEDALLYGLEYFYRIVYVGGING